MGEPAEDFCFYVQMRTDRVRSIRQVRDAMGRDRLRCAVSVG